PAPESTATRIASSPANASRILGTACHMSTETALCRAGLLKVIQPIAPSLRAIMRWVPVSIVVSIKDSPASRFNRAAALPPPPGGGRSARVRRTRAGRGWSSSPHPDASPLLGIDPPPPGEGEARALRGSNYH